MSLFVEEDDGQTYVDKPDSELASAPTSSPVTQVPVFENLEVKSNLPLKYQQEIVTDFVSRDGLLVMGRGLGWEVIVANILHILNMNNLKERLPNPPVNRKSLSIVLNASEYECEKLNKELIALQQNAGETAKGMTIIGAESMVADKRKKVYEQGGVVAVTSRILVVDLLSEILHPNEVNGLFILHAEKVRETSNDSFIASLFRDGNEWGFIKAFSDEPESFTGFTPLATRLKNLGLKSVSLWPRFHVEVSASLSFRNKKANADVRYVTEVNVALSYKMNKIQAAILYCLEACLNELRRHNPTLVTDYWDKENIHDIDFIQRMRFSLDSQWHRITKTSKQLLGDLGTLKDLLKYLTTVDSLTYYQIVQGIVDSNTRKSSDSAGTMNLRSMSLWLDLDEATTIISYAKERALGKRKVVRQSKVKKEETNEIEEQIEEEGQEEYNLEELPKWAQLESLLASTDRNSTTLIMCSNKTVAEQLGRLLHNYRVRGNVNGRGYMINKLNDYLMWKEMSKLYRKLNLEIEQGQEEAEETQMNTSKTFTRGKNEVVSKRRRTRGASAVANVGKLYSGTNQGKSSEAVELDEEIMDRLFEEAKEEEEEDDDVIIKSESHDTSQVIIECYDDKYDETLLNSLNPTHIIMYEPNLSFIRRVEIFQATHVSNPAKVFFMYYGTSIEEQRHLLTIKREKESFTKLIREKANLGRHFETAEDNVKFKITTKDIINTRVAGGMKFQGEDEEFRVIVDVREFRSSLPNLLYRVGTKVLPCMLTVGDYILTPKICVERKAIPDLISSFKSGRLYNQCEQMFRHYETPVLLIEFDESKSFSFEPFSEYRNYRAGGAANPQIAKLSSTEIQSKLMMLLVSFPKLKIVWSSSPYETAQIFVELKRGQEPPDVSKAIMKGLNDAGDGQPQLINEDAIDLIQCIPGITSLNYYKIIKRVKNIEEMVALSKEDFQELLGRENGAKAFNFINKSVKT